MALVNTETSEILKGSPTPLKGSPTPYQLMPGLTDEERASLRLDIENNGIRVPIDVDENDDILDGHHRAWIAAELGIDCPRRLVAGLKHEEKRAHAIAVNIMRRNLTREQRKDLVARLRREGMSQRAIAEATGLPKSTVGDDAKQVPESGHLTVNGKDGKQYPAQKPMDRLKEAAAKHPVEPPSLKSRAAVEARVAKAKEMAEQGYTSRQIAKAIGIEAFFGFKKAHSIEVPADAAVGRSRRLDANRIMQSLVDHAAALDAGHDLLAYDELDQDQIEEWVNSLRSSITFLTTVKNRLNKELTR